VIKSTREKLHEFNPRDLTNTAWAFAALGWAWHILLATSSDAFSPLPSQVKWHH
jgi:hypothetical protein